MPASTRKGPLPATSSTSQPRRRRTTRASTVATSVSDDEQDQDDSSINSTNKPHPHTQTHITQPTSTTSYTPTPRNLSRSVSAVSKLLPPNFQSSSRTDALDEDTSLSSASFSTPVTSTASPSTRAGSVVLSDSAVEVKNNSVRGVGEVEDMLSSATEGLNSGPRARHIEDLADLEEKGMLMRRASSQGSREDEDGFRRRKDVGIEPGTGMMDYVQVRKVEMITVSDEEENHAGLQSRSDKEAFALLILLYLLQGIPLGLTFGTLPFLLKPHLSYSQLAVFALSTWPYSLKLLWSPIVDAWFVPRWGRRKSWIVPVQAIVGLGMWVIGGRVEEWLEADEVDVRFITSVFGSLIFAAATQGWALTLLSSPNLSYASTAQTIGLGIGTALSFTVFLAFNSLDFSNKYFRSQPLDYPLVSLGGYLRFWAVVYILVTIGLVFFKKEDTVSADDPDLDVKKVYKVMWSIIRLKNIQSFLIILLVSKIGFQVNESVTSLKLLEKGLSKEDMAVAVLLDFPAQMIVGWLAAKWSRPKHHSSTHSSTSSKRHPLSDPSSSASSSSTGSGVLATTGWTNSGVLGPWVAAFWARLIMAAIATLVVAFFPVGSVGTGYFSLIVATTLLSSLTSTVQFVGITAFHTQIADPLIGGTYMTLLNTVSNLGGTWPKPLILRAVDILTIATCSTTGLECTSERGKLACSTSRGGTCNTTRDGYYIMSAICIATGAALLIMFILPTVRRLQSLPMSAWRVKIPN